jgi:hypothetical protein
VRAGHDHFVIARRTGHCSRHCIRRRSLVHVLRRCGACIAGSSHKPWFDSLPGQMQGVDVVDAEKVLQ